jgi:hypothetical protein
LWWRWLRVAVRDENKRKAFLILFILFPYNYLSFCPTKLVSHLTTLSSTTICK